VNCSARPNRTLAHVGKRHRGLIPCKCDIVQCDGARTQIDNNVAVIFRLAVVTQDQRRVWFFEPICECFKPRRRERVGVRTRRSINDDDVLAVVKVGYVDAIKLRGAIIR
jgi:hypothetical protein